MPIPVCILQGFVFVKFKAPHMFDIAHAKPGNAKYTLPMTVCTGERLFNLLVYDSHASGGNRNKI